MALPIPCPAPVTIATLPFSLPVDTRNPSGDLDAPAAPPAGSEELIGDPAAVDAERFCGDISGPVAREERDRIDDLLDGAQAMHRCPPLVEAFRRPPLRDDPLHKLRPHD